MKVVEVFKSIQGEGVYTGVPVVFVRMGGCNLACEWCDTKYSWGDEFIEYGVDELVAEIEACADGCKTICFTGGEPMLQQDELEGVAMLLHVKEYTLHVETNGTIPPERIMSRCIDFWSVSPKMQYTPPNTIVKFLKKFTNQAQLKFVVSSEQDTQGIMKYVDALSEISYEGKKCPYVVVVQPERYAATRIFTPDSGISKEDEEYYKNQGCSIASTKQIYLQHMEDVINWCEKHLDNCNWRVLPQLHYLIWGDRKGI